MTATVALDRLRALRVLHGPGRVTGAVGMSSRTGIDGRLYLHEGVVTDTKQVILSVKAGRNISVAMVRDLGHVVQRESTKIGVLITMTEPTQPMRMEAASASFYHSQYFNRDSPRLQIRAVAGLLAGKGDCHPIRPRMHQAPNPWSGLGGQRRGQR